ncbi:unnamed protein product [Vitrella brassicaformis CCMP3155]|uniref:beta-glucosidase n=1 Tax=Vitrella brassicaformis (strain CCMP3155) TaxID=1169540 RepID=A0A0G4GN32_VITBC|nr:unnamed protein product [Vitrella brassicaformis CCMP3155]|eukprot:CEM31609.1 unnamed protein product [Vitrella brassicaformis CCMP3155]
MWGTATAAYQVEGGWNEGGRVPSHWDTFTHTSAAKGLRKIRNDDNVRGRKQRHAALPCCFQGDVACDFYHKYKDDIKLMKDLNFTHFRYSISWPRVMNGTEINEEGIQFYRNLTALLIENGIEPVVTLYHWDLPDIYDWRNETVMEAFGEFANLMFDELQGVKFWITFNEPYIFCKFGYHLGNHAPGVKSAADHLKCGHNVLKSHAKAYSIWKELYEKERPDAMVGITLNSEWYVPFDGNDPDDLDAARALTDLQVGWFADPIYGTGDYPESLKAHYGDDMPLFTEKEKAAVKGSADFFGLNHYTTRYVKATAEGGYRKMTMRRSVPIGPQAASSWLYIVPWGFSRLLKYVNQRWKPKSIIVTENGMSDEDSNDTASLIDDQNRVWYYQEYLKEMAKAMLEGSVPVAGYFAWSLMDNFEWAEGFDERFGLTYVDFNDPERPRTAKRSAKYLGALIPSVEAQIGACQSLDNLTANGQLRIRL